MFDWLFRPTCPCDRTAKAWLEDRLHWLYNEFPDNIFTTKRMVLPLPKYFPDKFDGSDASVQQMFDRVCQYMEVDREQIQLKIVQDAKDNFFLVNEAGHALPHAAGTFSIGDRYFLVRLDRSGFHDPMSLVGTMAHELSHVRLMGEGRYAGDAFDNELLTDLTTVYMGLGIFLANSPRNWRSQYSTWPDTSQRRPEYMTPPMFGWALAHIAWHNHEGWPQWASHLKSDARVTFKQGWKYLRATEDSTFKP